MNGWSSVTSHYSMSTLSALPIVNYVNAVNPVNSLSSTHLLRCLFSQQAAQGYAHAAESDGGPDAGLNLF